MFLLRREYRDGADRPEIVFLHAEVVPEWAGAGAPERMIRVAAETAEPGRRAAHVRIPEPPGGGSVSVRYRFSAVRDGAEWYSPSYAVSVPSDELIADLFRIPEEGGGNLVPAEGRGYFRLVLPVAGGERPGRIPYGYGAMRKKPAPSLCRAAVEAGNGPPPVVEIPEALSVLKERPMPYFLYHVSEDGSLRSDKIACARITLADAEGDIVSARLLWGDPAWRAMNVSPMEAKGFPAGPLSAGRESFEEDIDAWRSERLEALSRLRAPRVFEAYVFGPSGSRVEHCFQAVVRLPSGGYAVRWRNREGGRNWEVTL
ncbi:MAG: hypothetical protein AB1346_06810 [Thermodesulfobacteriota bacterium]